MNFNQSKYRITYEAFSKYSSKLSKATTLEEALEVTYKNLKYFFNYHYVRINYISEVSPLCFLFSVPEFRYLSKEIEVFEFEKDLLERKVPVVKQLSNAEAQKYIQLETNALTNPEMYASCFDYNSVNICVSIISDENRKFGMDDVEILRILIDAFFNKIKQIRLQNRLEEKNKNLEIALTEIDHKNREIESIVNTQKAIIKVRTKHVVERNERLIDILQSISHNLQEPLSRILGLLNLAENSTQDEFKMSILPYLNETALELDDIFKNLIKKSSEDINLLSEKK
ncbi:hypothetical protein ACFSO9_05340 [Mesonia maritima]|uniref:hypothetical protein n=1 Tax=Mesonia maritima TaxID=1793873 RepID=UPI003638FBDC